MLILFEGIFINCKENYSGFINVDLSKENNLLYFLLKILKSWHWSRNKSLEMVTLYGSPLFNSGCPLVVIYLSISIYLQSLSVHCWT